MEIRIVPPAVPWLIMAIGLYRSIAKAVAAAESYSSPIRVLEIIIG